MRNIIRLIQKYKNFLFFLLLETIAISFLFSWRNSYHSSTFLGSSNAVSAGLFDFKYDVISYFNLREINEVLQKENSVLKEKTLNKELLLGKRFVKVDDTLFYKQYKFQEAKIINSQFKFSENNLLVNKGKLNGIEPRMGFIGTEGVFGIVDQVSDHFSSIKPLINDNFGLKVIHQKTNTWGDFNWIPSQNNYRTAFINNMPIYTEVTEKDAMITSGSDGIFPYGLKVGHVLSIEKDIEQQTLKITIEIEEDYSRAHIGFVVKNLLKDEFNLLNNTNE